MERVRAPEPLNEEKFTDYDEKGVDLTLIRWWQTLTPLERLRFVDEYDNSLAAILKRNDRE